METVAKLAKKYRLAKLCRIGVWIVAIAGAAQIASNSYFVWLNYQQNQINLGMNHGIDLYNQIYSSPAYGFFQFASPIFQTIAVYIFYGIILFAASVVFQAISTQPATTSATGQSAPTNTPEVDGAGLEEEEDIVYTTLKSADIARDRKQLNHHKHFTVEPR